MSDKPVYLSAEFQAEENDDGDTYWVFNGEVDGDTMDRITALADRGDRFQIIVGDIPRPLDGVFRQAIEWGLSAMEFQANLADDEALIRINELKHVLDLSSVRGLPYVDVQPWIERLEEIAREVSSRACA